MCYLYFFFFKDTATTEIYTYWHTLSLHDALPISADSPPLLLGAANDDACCSAPTVDLLQAYRQAGASAEIHLYAAGGHAFNLGEDTPLVSRSEEHTSELQSLMRISYAVFCLKKKQQTIHNMTCHYQDLHYK